jgi:hypothetical protein
MVTATHEALHRIFQKDPQLFARSLTRLGIAFPEAQAVTVLSADLTETEPIERRVDTALLVETDEGRHVLVIESQTAREPSRRMAWPYYVAYLHNKHACPVTLMVVTADRSTADWARRPIVVGLPKKPTQITQPLVLSPDNVPRIGSADLAEQDVMFTVLSALTHRKGDDVDEILQALAAALARTETETATYLAEFTEVGLGKGRAAKIWRALMRTMNYGFESQLHREWREEGREEGLVQGTAIAVLRVLTARGIAIPDEIARRVHACTDRTVLEDLHIRAITVERAEDLFPDLEF